MLHRGRSQRHPGLPARNRSPRHSRPRRPKRLAPAVSMCCVGSFLPVYLVQPLNGHHGNAWVLRLSQQIICRFTSRQQISMAVRLNGARSIAPREPGFAPGGAMLRAPWRHGSNFHHSMERICQPRRIPPGWLNAVFTLIGCEAKLMACERLHLVHIVYFVVWTWRSSVKSRIHLALHLWRWRFHHHN